MPDRTSIRSNSGQLRRNSWCSCSAAEAHHPLDVGAVVPAAVEQDDLAGGRQVVARTAGSTTGFVRARSAWGVRRRVTMRGLVRSVMRLITPPLPAEPRPSKMIEHLQALLLDPVLELHELFLEPSQLALVERLLEPPGLPCSAPRRRASNARPGRPRPAGSVVVTSAVVLVMATPTLVPQVRTPVGQPPAGTGFGSRQSALVAAHAPGPRCIGFGELGRRSPPQPKR